MNKLNAGNFKDFVKEGSTIVDFWAEWCMPCKMLEPIFEELSNEMENIKFAKLDVDADQELAAGLGIRGIPTMIMFKDGKEISRVSGFMTKETLKQKLESVFQ